MYHIKCAKEDIAAKVIVCGDPGRTERVAGFLEDARLVSSNRGLLTYTGEYKGEIVTISTTGMGAPSAAIVLEELAMLGAKAVIRVGTTGGISEKVMLGDVVIPNEAVPLDGATKAYMREGGLPVADAEIVKALKDKAEAIGLKCHVGMICTSDTFYLEEQRDAVMWASKGVLSFEMECSVIFVIGRLRGYRAGAILTATGVIGAHDRILDSNATAKSIERSAISSLDVVAGLRIQ
jgi:purine-nucleoside phosphorylase